MALKGDIHLRQIDARRAIARRGQGEARRRRRRLGCRFDGWDVDGPQVLLEKARSARPRGAENGRRRRGQTTNLNAVVDLAALARQAPHLLRLRDGLAIDRGSARLSVRTAPAVGGELPLAIEAKISDVVARDVEKTITLSDPATVSALMMLGKSGYRVERLDAKTPFLDVTGSGGATEGDLGRRGSRPGGPGTRTPRSHRLQRLATLRERPPDGPSPQSGAGVRGPR